MLCDPDLRADAARHARAHQVRAGRAVEQHGAARKQRLKSFVCHRFLRGMDFFLYSTRFGGNLQ